MSNSLNVLHETKNSNSKQEKKNESIDKEIKYSITYENRNNHSYKVDVEIFNPSKEIKSRLGIATRKTINFLENPSENIIADSIEIEKKDTISEKNYFLSLPKKESNFCSDYIDEANVARYDFTSYSKKFDKLKKKIFLFENVFYLSINDTLEVPLYRGLSPLQECLDFFKYNSTKKLEKIEIIDELKVPFFEGDTENIDEIRNFNKLSLEEIEKNVEGKYDILNFRVLKCVDNPEYAFILSIVDEGFNEKETRNLFFSKRVKFVGIN